MIVPRQRRDLDRREYRRNRARFLDGVERCAWCRRHVSICGPLTIDHVVPQDTGHFDALDETNWLPACRSCNGRRGANYVNAKRTGRRRTRRAAVAFIER